MLTGLGQNNGLAMLDASGNPIFPSPSPLQVALNNATQILNAQKAGPLQNIKIQGRTLTNRFGRDGGCEDASKWSQNGGTPSVDSSNYTTGITGLKVTVDGTYGWGGTAYVPLWNSSVTKIDKNKYYIVLADIKNGTATSASMLFEVVGGGSGKNSQAITQTGSFTTVWVKIQPSDMAGAGVTNINVHANVNSSASGQYAYFDSFRMYEITQAEYNALGSTLTDGSLIATKYSYVNDSKHLRGFSIIRYGENLLPSFSSWLMSAHATILDPYTVKYTNTTAQYETTYVDVPFVIGQTYTMSGTITNITGSGSYIGFQFIDASGNKISEVNTASNPNGGFAQVSATVPAGTVILRCFTSNNLTGLTATYSNLVMNVGSAPLSRFKARNDDAIFLPVPLASSADGSVCDQVYHSEGRYWVENQFAKDLILDGSLTWLYDTSMTGLKVVYIKLSDLYTVSINRNTVTKYDGTILFPFSSGWNSPDLTYAFQSSSASSPIIEVSISSKDSGWGDSYTPTAQEMQAYFWGWVMTTQESWNGTPQLYNGTGTKGWVRRYVDSRQGPLFSGSVGCPIGPIVQGSGVQSVPTKPSPLFTPYKATYQLAYPKVDDLTGVMEGQIHLLEGVNQIEVASGFILKEKTIPQGPVPANSQYFINTNVNGVPQQLAYRANRIIDVYKNGSVDRNWYLSQRPAGNVAIATYGPASAGEQQNYFDPSSSYEVTYQVLDQHLLTASAVTTVTAEYDANMKTVQDRIGQMISDYGQRLSDTEMLAKKIYGVPTRSVADTSLYVDANNGSDGNDGSPMRPFKTIQRAVNMCPQILNHSFFIYVAAGTYNEDVYIEGIFQSSAGDSLGGAQGFQLIGASSPYDPTNWSVNSITIDHCFGRVYVQGFYSPTTTRVAFTASYSYGVIFSYVKADGNTVGLAGGVNFVAANGRVDNSNISNKQTAISAGYYCQVYTASNAGSGNNTGLYAYYGAILSLVDSTQPTGTSLAANVGQGGMIVPASGVLNPWGDNTASNKSSASVYQNSGMPTMTGGVSGKIICNSKNSDNKTEYDTTTGRFTSKSGGRYSVCATVAFGNPSSAMAAYIMIYKNGGQYASIYGGQINSNVNNFCSGSINMTLAAGDYIELWAQTGLTQTLISGSLFNVDQIG